MDTHTNMMVVRKRYSMDKIVIYSADWCPSCVSAKRFLEEKNIPYEEISKILQDIKNANKNSKIILSMGKQNLLSKIAMILAGKPNAHNNTVISYNKLLEVLKKYCKILDVKKNIYFMTDVFYAEFY